AGDGDDRTSDAIFVATGDRPNVEVGDEVQVGGRVVEWRRRNRHQDLSNTNLIAEGAPEVLSRGNPLPAPVRIGGGGVRLEGPTPALLEALERLEGMRVAVQNAQAAGPMTQHGELCAIPDRGAGLEQRTHFGGARGSARQKVYDLLRVRLSAQQQQ